MVGAPHSLNFVLDPDVEDTDISLVASDVTFEQAFDMMLRASGTAHKVIGPNAILIYPDTPEKRKQHADQVMKTFHLHTVKAERMAEIINAAVPVGTLVSNAQLNTIQVRETPETIVVIEKLIAANDRAPAEIMLDVEILEINGSKGEQLGIDFGSQMTASMPKMNLGTLARGSVAGAGVGQSLATLPSLTFKYFKNDVDAQVLARPRIRTTDGNPATIHIGDRVPLRSATVQDATGQTRTQFEYRDVGIRLEVVPEYNLDDTVTVDLNLEVSSLGQNIGTASEPAYSIGTRNVDTVMILREGETAVLGGLIRDEERRNWKKVPGLSASRLLGRLFSVNDDSDTHTDLLLTITPRLIRGQALPDAGTTEFYSGTADRITTREPNKAWRRSNSKGTPPRFSLSPGRSSPRGQMVRDDGPDPLLEDDIEAQLVSDDGPTRSAGVAAPTAPSTGETGLAFASERYAVGKGETVSVDVMGYNLAGLSGVKARVLFNPAKVTLVGATGPGGRKVKASPLAEGGVDLALADLPKGENAVVAKLTLKGTQKGLSYLLLNDPGGSATLKLGSSKVEVR